MTKLTKKTAGLLEDFDSAATGWGAAQECCYGSQAISAEREYKDARLALERRLADIEAELRRHRARVIEDRRSRAYEDPQY